LLILGFYKLKNSNMQKLIILIAALTISAMTMVAAPVREYFKETDDLAISKKRDTLKNDTLLYARRFGTELKFTLNKDGELGILFNENQTITVKSDGYTGFGTKNPEYRVDVCGSIRASEELIVEANKWCDFVFDEEYQLQPFQQRILTIKKDKHLPYIKPEEEILNSGVPISETLTGLLQNVEELYLYIEQLENRIKTLEEENKNLKSE
jgi:hypothetical protein